MKWFKHIEDSRHNKKIEWVCNRLGADAGYARVFKLYEIVAGLWKDRNTDIPRIKIANGPGNLQFFAKELGISVEEVEKTFSVLAKAEIIDRKSWRAKYLYIPQLAEYSNSHYERVKQRRPNVDPTYKEEDKKKNRIEEEEDGEKMHKSHQELFMDACTERGLKIEPTKYDCWKTLASMCRTSSVYDVLEQFKKYLEKYPKIKRPLTGFTDNLPEVVQNLDKKSANPQLQTFCDYASDKSDMRVIFNHDQKQSISDFLDEKPYEEILLAFNKFYDIIETDPYQLKFAAKDFVEKLPQILRTFEKRRARDLELKKIVEDAKEALKAQPIAITDTVAGADPEDILSDLGLEESL